MRKEEFGAASISAMRAQWDLRPASLRGVLASLEKLGVYKSQGDDCFGLVQMPQ
jgi:hypothetical protein